MEHYRCYTCYTPRKIGNRQSDVVYFLPNHLIMPGFSTIEKSTKADNELIQILKNPGPKTPFMIGETQFHVIDRLATLFHNLQPQQPNTTVFTREVPKVAPLRVPVIVPSPRVPMTVAPPRVIEPRDPVISHEENIEDIRQINMIESDKVQQKYHRYPTGITQLSQEINQAENKATPTHNTQHQQWLLDLHEKVKGTPNLINTCLQENMTNHPQ